MLLNVRGVHKLYADNIILSGVDLRIGRREKVALVGRNGTGKTTLLRIITGEESADGGSVTFERGITIGYLKQSQALVESRTVLEEAEQAREHLVELEKRLSELEKRLESDATEEEIEEYGLLHEHFHAEGGYSLERDLQVVLKRMGFAEGDFEKPIAKLSGGERTRLMLAKLLLEEPELLILDEPTNHLDLEATEWLEGWVRSYQGAVLIVSHDRVFLNNVSQRVVELKDGRCKSYPGNFEKFLVLRQEEDERLAKVAAQQRAEMARLDEFVRRFIDSQRTAQARGRQKQLMKLKEHAITAPKSDPGMHAAILPSKRSGNTILESKNLGVRFDDRTLFQGLDWTVRIGEKWGVIGANGSGKSTLLKCILEQAKPTEGALRLGANIEAGYFAQDAETVDPDKSPYEVMNYEADMDEAEARNHLGRFLITGDDVFRPSKTLSGGERNKLQLALLAALNPNLLLLDEPTNHLDMDSREALAHVLQLYHGTLILVSHDRWLLDQVTNHTLDLGRERVSQYAGRYSDYRASIHRPKPKVAAKSPSIPSANLGVRFRTPGEVELTPRELSKEIERLKKAVTETEAEVSQLEEQLEELERVMATPPAGSDLFALSTNHAQLRSQIEEAIGRWEAETSQLESLSARQSN